MVKRTRRCDERLALTPFRRLEGLRGVKKRMKNTQACHSTLRRLGFDGGAAATLRGWLNTRLSLARGGALVDFRDEA